MPGLLKGNVGFLSGAVAMLTLVFYLIYKSSIPNTCFDIDEADYMYSLEKGFAAHYLDKNAISFISFVKLGISKGFKNDKKTELSRTIRSADDINLYRHFHGPLYFYYMMIGEKIVGKDERAVRAFTMLLQLLCSIVMVVCCVILLGRQYGRVPLFLTSFMVLLSPTLFFTVSLVSPHGLYTVWCLLSLTLMVKAVDSKKEAYFYLSAGVVAAAFLTTAYAILLLLCWGTSVVVLYWADRNAIRNLRKFLINALIIYAAVIFALWPAAFLKLSLIKTYILLAYWALIRAHLHVSQPLWPFWWNRISASPVEYGIIAAGSILTIYLIVKRKRLPLIPLLAYLILIFLMEVRHVAWVPTYVSSLIAVGLFTAGIALSEVLKNKKITLVSTLLLLSLFIFLHLYFYYLPHLQMKASIIRTEVVAFLKKEMPEKVLVSRPILSMIHYYFRDMKADSYTAEMVSKSEEMADIKRSLANATDYNGIIYFGSSMSEIQAIAAERYQTELINFSRPDWPEQWAFFRLHPKTIEPVP